MKPRCLDLFCGAGGATRGLQLAGFHVFGVDARPQPRYCGDIFWEEDALALPIEFLRSFDFIWASPPCQDYSALKGLATVRRPRLVSTVRDMLVKAGVPFVIENVVGSDLQNPIQLCGSMFGLGVWRHRLFEMHPPLVFVPECRHALCPEPIDVTGTGGPFNGIRKAPGGGSSRKPRNIAHASAVMGIDWMTRKELSQAIPPAYSEFIGKAALQFIQNKVAA